MTFAIIRWTPKAVTLMGSRERWEETLSMLAPRGFYQPTVVTTIRAALAQSGDPIRVTVSPDDARAIMDTAR